VKPARDLGDVVWPFDDVGEVHDICRTGREIGRQRSGHCYWDPTVSEPEHRLDGCIVDEIDHSLRRHLITRAFWAVRECHLFASLHARPS
jgi:hypothetical protein